MTAHREPECTPQRDSRNGASGWIYHLTTASELRAGCSSAEYAPRRLAEDGFVHCAGTPVLSLAVATDYFASARETVYVLRIDPSRLTAPLRFEAPAPIPGGGRNHLARAETFPHVYGAIARAAVVDVGALERADAGFRWPIRFEPLGAVLGP